jgi:ADP-ribose pyrophosphatase YjhB (NUDIX family)
MESIRMTGRIVCFNDENALLLISSANGQAWVTPGGTVEPGEDIRAAAAREAAEEAGVRVRPGRLLYVQELVRTHERVVEFFFLAEPAAGERVRGRWTVADPDGPRRTVAWLSAADLATTDRRVLPAVLLTAAEQRARGFADQDPFLGRVDLR